MNAAVSSRIPLLWHHQAATAPMPSPSEMEGQSLGSAAILLLLSHTTFVAIPARWSEIKKTPSYKAKARVFSLAL